MDVNTLRERLADAINGCIDEFEGEQSDRQADISRLESELEDVEIVLGGALSNVESCLRLVRELTSF